MHAKVRKGRSDRSSRRTFRRIIGVDGRQEHAGRRGRDSPEARGAIPEPQVARQLEIAVTHYLRRTVQRLLQLLDATWQPVLGAASHRQAVEDQDDAEQ